ncbi:hypothetical protein M409DRAFT_24999 [Zasmidium cellare ATCC 36951]|uniref:Uncharacterized protein n=1 Tax=Zasmidium cellare ATCC 36951 TaxID=1080233 RepID=A0A6A6CCZ0_ZASCE|nr:uncharacterized protein M409DRAFT_24999 [Zasmidium cellare ATCC 36951]KAF2164603.1 hypothetical protein M409DRAFT_24999 [Zasmidium cellare ATCC 36951]
MQAAHHALAQPLRASTEKASKTAHPTSRNHSLTVTASPSRREPDQENNTKKNDQQGTHNGILSKAITPSALEELQASTRLLHDELRKHNIPMPNAASVLEKSSKKHLQTALTESKLLRMRHGVQELLRVAREDGGEDGEVLGAYCERNGEELRRVLEGG